VLFSKTPSEAGLLRREVRCGKGDGYQFAIDLVDYRLVTEREGSDASLAMAKAVPQVPGKPPVLFPFFTDMKLSEERSTEQAVANERAALRLIGIGGEKQWPSHFFFHLMTEMLRAGHAGVRRHLPGVPTTVNFACELLDGNLVSRSVDGFEILGSGALAYGWHEGWGGWARTRQVNGYYVDVMRAACRAPGVEFGIYNILCRTPWEIQARAFLEFGHGVRAMHFFTYGPYYAITGDANSHRTEIYEPVKRVTYATGAVERDTPLGLDEALGVSRTPLVLRDQPGRAEYE